MAEANCSTTRNSTLRRDKKPPLWEIKTAIDHDPTNAGYYNKLARHYMELPVKNEDLKYRINEEIIKNLENALSLNPVNGLYWYDLGLGYSRKARQGGEHLSKWLPKADIAFERAIYFRPNDPGLLHNIGRYWVRRSRTLPKAEVNKARNSMLNAQKQGPSDSQQWTRKEAISKFQAFFRRSLEIDTTYWKNGVRRVWNYYPDEKIVMGIVPEGNKDLSSRVKKWLASMK